MPDLWAVFLQGSLECLYGICTHDFVWQLVPGSRWTIVPTKNECLDCSVLQSGTLRPFEFFIKRLSMIFVVSQSLYTLALMFLLGLAVVTKSAVGSAGTNPSTTLYSRIRRRLCRLSSSVSSSNCRFMVVIDPGPQLL